MEKPYEHEFQIDVLDISTNKIITMPFEEYVWRVTAKEIPASFEDEAIKAQAVAARTYALRKIGKAIKEHGSADMCTDFNHCTAFLLPETEARIYGNNAEKICERYKKLSNDTYNQILTYNNQPILAVFHAISSGVTEKSSDVWSTQLPYLINVNSDLDKNVEGYYSKVSYTKNELKEMLNCENDGEINIISRTSGGSVKKIEVFGKSFSGFELRTKLNLRSANFTVAKNADNYIFNVVGYGHGVGMSQSGANEYAKTSMNYKEILSKYYPQTILTTIDKI